MIISTGLAGAISSSVWGVLSDKSSRLTISVAALIVGVLGLIVVATLNFAPVYTNEITFYAAILFILGVAHAGVRIGRKTHIVDLASGDQKAEYVALSNTIIGVALLVLGALTSIFISIGLEFCLTVLSAMALFGAGMGLTMKHVQG